MIPLHLCDFLASQDQLEASVDAWLGDLIKENDKMLDGFITELLKADSADFARRLDDGSLSMVAQFAAIAMLASLARLVHHKANAEA